MCDSTNYTINTVMIASVGTNCKAIQVHHTAMQHVVLSPDLIFRTAPCDWSKNRVWTLSLRKLGQVYMWQVVNWVIVGVNYIISNQQRLLWRQKICKLAIYDDA